MDTTLERRPTSAPVYEGEFWSDEVILNPYPTYTMLRSLGPVVWMERHNAFAFTHHASVSRALLNPSVYSSGHGTMMNDAMNQASKGIMLNMDDPEHLALRRLFTKPLTPKALTELKPRISQLAHEQVTRLVQRGTFDAVKDLAHFLPFAVVVELVGLDREGQENMLEWAAGIFNAFGPPDNERTIEGARSRLKCNTPIW